MTNRKSSLEKLAVGGGGGGRGQQPCCRLRPWRLFWALALPDGAELQPKVRESHGYLVRARSRPHGWCFVRTPTWGSLAACQNPVACDRVGLIVRLRRPAVVTATIDGLALSLNDPTWSGAFPTGRPTIFIYAGFLQPADMTTRMHVPPSLYVICQVATTASERLVPDRFRLTECRPDSRRRAVSLGWAYKPRPSPLIITT